jgi:hypothetical protein
MIGSATASHMRNPGTLHRRSTINSQPSTFLFPRHFDHVILARTLVPSLELENLKHGLASDAGVPIDEPAVPQNRYATYSATVIEAWSRENLNPFRSPWKMGEPSRRPALQPILKCDILVALKLQRAKAQKGNLISEWIQKSAE